MAIRIARCAAKQKNIAVCGYHGWHDWYLASNLNKNQLNNHLLPNLKTLGVHEKLKNTVFTFDYNNKKQLMNLIEQKKIGIIKMEVARNNLPNVNFLKFVRNLADKKKIVLIFDECTTGFKKKSWRNAPYDRYNSRYINVGQSYWKWICNHCGSGQK